MDIGKTMSLQLDLEQSRVFWGNLQAVSTNMVSMTDSVLASVKDIGDVTVSDHEDVSNQVKSLDVKCQEILRVMQQKTKDWLQYMDEAWQAKETETSFSHVTDVIIPASSDVQAFAMVEQMDCTNVGSTVEPEEMEVLIGALRHSCPLQLARAWRHLSRISPVLQQLCERASMAMEQSNLHQTQREQALEDRAKIQQELEQTEESLQDAMQQIGDLNTQTTILTTEMAALRQELTEVEQECSRLQKGNTALSATVTSTMASYAFLEQALGSETKKRQQSMHEVQEAREKAIGLEQALEASQQRVLELTEAFAQMESQAKAQTAQLGQLQTLEAELSRLNELNEFLELESKMTQEQMMQSNEMLCRQLQSLRERNLECEDLKQALSQLREERDSLEEKLDMERAMLLKQGEQMSQVANTTSTLHHQILLLTTVLEHTINAKAQAPESSTEDGSTSKTSTHEEKEESSSKTSDDTEVEHGHVDELGSTGSAFCRVTATTATNEKETTAVVTVVADLADMFTKFQTTFNQYERYRDAEQDHLRKAKALVEEHLRGETHRHQQEEQDLREQLQTQVDKKNAAVKQKDQDKKSLTKLSTDMNNIMEQTHNLKLENIELRNKEAELQQLLQQSRVEVQILREELTRAGSQSASSTKAMDERILLCKQVEKLKLSLAEVEESKSKILEKAKRHESVHKINQSKLVRELHLLDDMIETVRKTLSSMPHVVNNCVELQELMEYLG
ncbi:hypothetical protein ACEWY4_007480 [Coilia grayii]|uniref:Uncharacterized protein n=1 Tax=Coilia grayii TaxID=363190 RepID=A0ABD1KGS0_9TELE